MSRLCGCAPSLASEPRQDQGVQVCIQGGSSIEGREEEERLRGRLVGEARGTPGEDGIPKTLSGGRDHQAAPQLSEVGAITLRGSALPRDVARGLETHARGRRDQPAGLALGRARAAHAAFAGDVGSGKRRGSGVNEMNSRLQTGPSGGVCAGPPFLAPAREGTRGRTWGGVWELAGRPRRRPAVSEASALKLPAPRSPESARGSGPAAPRAGLKGCVMD